MLQTDVLLHMKLVTVTYTTDKGLCEAYLKQSLPAPSLFAQLIYIETWLSSDKTPELKPQHITAHAQLKKALTEANVFCFLRSWLRYLLSLFIMECKAISGALRF